ncbi:MAG: exodeoxyribonuclease VII large subunit, partial [Terriglobales bacterium]
MGELQTDLPFPPERKIWSVSALLARLKTALDRDFFDLWVEGEISNFHQAASRHCYFTLKDARGQLRAVLFAQQARLLRFRPADGLQVLVRGRLSLFESRGDLQLYAEHIEPLGRGDLQLAFEQLKEKLQAEGLFAPERKRPLPRLPRRIALVTSPRGAAVADLVHVLRRRFPNLEIRLYPVAVQGDAAVGEICEALAYFARPEPAWLPDLLILARGGGSLEDLWAFNT